MKKVITYVVIGVLCLAMALALAACGDKETQTQEQQNPVVRFTFSTGDVVTVELYPDQAPITVANFLTYVREGYYKGTTIHRIESYVVQGGGYIIKEYAYADKGGTHDPIKGEFATNGVANSVSHTAGAISMARTTAPDSATSQFFFCPVDMSAQWDGNYAAFGHVTDDESLAAIVRLSKMATVSGSTYPASPIVIRSVEIIAE